MRLRFFASILLVCALLTVARGPVLAGEPAWSAPARAEAAQQRGEARVEAELLIHPDREERLEAGVWFRLAPGWHLYWRNPGESGLPTQLRFHSSAGDSVDREAAFRWPAPALFEEAEGTISTYGYADEVMISAYLPTPEPGGRIAVEADLLVCKDECIPARFELSRAVDGGEANAAAHRALFAKAEARLPRPAAAAGLDIRVDALALSDGPGAEPGRPFRAQLGLECDGCELSAAHFFPYGSDALEVAPPVEALSQVGPGQFSLPIHGEVWTDGDRELAGVLVLEQADGSETAIEVALPFVATPAVPPAAIPPPPPPAFLAWIEALALALLGGLILNLMPCVLPVLAIKACSVAEMAERSRRELLGHGLAYTAGVLLSMLALGTVVLVLRGAGSAVGWGFQFQEPLFVAVVASVVVAFALNLFGVYEIELGTGALGNLGSDAHGWQRSLFEGLLAVVLATPCSAPFLGTAVGFAFASSGPAILSIFLAIGLGLAAPYLAISTIPGLARFLPRPGAWMLQLRVGLGFALLATTLWLLWVVGRSAGSDAIIALATFLLVLAFALWVFGLLQHSERVGVRRMAACGVLIFALAGLDTVSLEPKPSGAQSTDEQGKSWARPFDPAAIQSALVRGKPVFVYFTADWCITCKVNEQGVLRDEGIRERMRQLEYQVFRGDWTQRDERVRQELARFGRAGVPLYVVYDPNQPTDPKVLPELLSVGLLDEALIAAAGSLP